MLLNLNMIKVKLIRFVTSIGFRMLLNLNMIKEKFLSFVLDIKF